MTPSELRLRRVSHRGKIAEWTLNPLWTKLDRETNEEFGMLKLFLVSRGTSLRWKFPVAQGAGKLAAALGAALGEARRGPTGPLFKVEAGGMDASWVSVESDIWRPPCSRQTVSDLAPLSSAAADYDVVRHAIAHMKGNWRAQPEFHEIAEAAGVTPTELHHLSAAGRADAQGVPAGAHARQRAQPVRDSASVLDASYEVGLSGPGRLHDLFVTHEAMSPGEWKTGGDGLTIYRLPSLRVRHRAGDGDGPRTVRARVCRPRRGKGGDRGHAPPLAAANYVRIPPAPRRSVRASSTRSSGARIGRFAWC